MRRTQVQQNSYSLRRSTRIPHLSRDMIINGQESAGTPSASITSRSDANNNSHRPLDALQERSPLDILAAATTLGENVSSNNISATKKCGTPAISKNKRKAPSRSPDSKCSTNEACSICLEVPEQSDQATVNGCEHRFCFNCIDQWAERENTCPLCKQRFTRIDRVHKKPRRTKAEMAAKIPVRNNTKLVKNRNQASDHGRIPLLANMDEASTRNLFHLLFSSNIHLPPSASLSSVSNPFSNENSLSGAEDQPFFSEDDDSLQGSLEGGFLGNMFSSGVIPPSVFSSVSMIPRPFTLPRPNPAFPVPGSTPDTAFEIYDSDDDDDDEVVVLDQHIDSNQAQRPPTPHPYV